MRVSLTIAALAAATLVTGCKGAGKGTVTVEEAPVIEEPTTAEKEAAVAAKRKAEGGDKAPEASPWGDDVAAMAKKLAVIASRCNEKYLTKLKPDELLVGMPALVTKDSVVTVLAKDCSSLADDYSKAAELMANKHPRTDDLLRHWSLVADLYGRFERTAINIGAKAKRRKLNAAEMKAELPNLTGTLIPELVKIAEELSKWDKTKVPGYPRVAESKAAAAAAWKAQFDRTAKDLAQLETAWVTYAHDPLSKEMYVRRRHLSWMNSYWTARLEREKKEATSVTAANSADTEKLRTAAKGFYEAANTWITNAWAPGLAAYADKSLIDEPKLKAAKKAFTTENKVFAKAVKKLKLP